MCWPPTPAIAYKNALARLVPAQGMTHRRFGPMCDHILYDPARLRNVRSANFSFPPLQAELICPRCYRKAGFSSAEAHVWCPTCGWIHRLTAKECETLVDALAGITDLNTQVYLQVLGAQDDPVASLPDDAA